MNDAGRRRRRAWLALLGAALAAAAQAAVPTPPTPHARLLPAADSGEAWILSADGRLQRAGGAGGASGTTAQGGGTPRLVDVVARGQRLYGLSPSADGKTTALLTIDAASGIEQRRWSVRGSGRLLAVIPDETRACVVGLKPSARASAAAEDWALWVVDLISGEVTGALSLGLVPNAVEALADPGAGAVAARLFIAARDRVVSYSLDPPRSSWFYLSPGDNRDLVGAAGSLVLFLLRSGQVAVVDPARRPRDEGRVRLGADDATSVISLPAPGRAIAVGTDGSIIAVLHEDGTTITSLDPADGRILETRRLPGRHDLMGRSLLRGTEPGSWSAATGSSESGAVATVALQYPSPPSSPADQAADATQAQAAEPPPTAPELEVKETAAAPQAPASEPADSQSAPPEPKDQPSPEAQDGPPPDLPAPMPAGIEIPPAEPPSSPEPPAAPRSARPSDEPALTGTITGALKAGIEILLYGPNNIIKLHVRAAVAADGAFKIALPPPGTYRMVVAAGAGVHVFTSPEYRTIRVEADGRGVEGNDFEIRGKL